MTHRSRLAAVGVLAVALVAAAACADDSQSRPRHATAEAAAAAPTTEPAGPVALPRPAAASRTKTLLGRQHPARPAVASSKGAELGMRFSVTKVGSITALRFFKGPGNAGPHRASLWAGSTRVRSVKVKGESASGWQSVRLGTPVPVQPGQTYTVSYLAPRGHWSLSRRGFSKPRKAGPLRAPEHAGRIGAPHRRPTHKVGASNFFVDVVMKPHGEGRTTLLDLPRVPWEGGPAYWDQFPRAKAGGWGKDTFFPIAVWFNGISSDAEVAYDKSVGINSYIGMYEGTDFKLFERNNVFWIGDQLNSTFDQQSKNWVGDFLDDEVDGRYPPAEGLAHLQQLVDDRAGDGRFKYANFTQTIMSSDLDASVANDYVNRFTDAVSLDMYWYTVPYCSQTPYRDPYITPVSQTNCRTASSYGKTMESLQKRDASDNRLQARWQFIEDLNGGPGEGPFVANIAPGQLMGAVMSSIINEARGIVYFNQSLSGPCQSGAVVRQAQVNGSFCGASQVAAMTQVDGFVRSLAPVINTQSYVYSFGPGLDTMLKAYGGDAYVFAMVDGSSQPGSRTFTLPPQVAGRSVDVVGENRTLPVATDGTFKDSFAAEYSFHVYRVPIS